MLNKYVIFLEEITKWQMLLNFGECKYLRNYRNWNINYKMGDTFLGTFIKEKDLGVTIRADI